MYSAGSVVGFVEGTVEETGALVPDVVALVVVVFGFGAVIGGVGATVSNATVASAAPVDGFVTTTVTVTAGAVVTAAVAPPVAEPEVVVASVAAVFGALLPHAVSSARTAATENPARFIRRTVLHRGIPQVNRVTRW